MIGRPAQKCITSEIHWKTRMKKGATDINTRKAHFLLHVVEGVWGVDGKANEDDV
jgi:hypothetical protein